MGVVLRVYFGTDKNPKLDSPARKASRNTGPKNPAGKNAGCLAATTRINAWPPKNDALLSKSLMTNRSNAIFLSLTLFLLNLTMIGCQRQSAGNNSDPSVHKPSLGETLQSSFALSADEKTSRTISQQKQQEQKAHQQKLQQDRLKSYSDTGPMDPM